MSAMARREATSVVMAILALTTIACLPPGRRAAAAPNTWKQIAGGVPTSRHGGVLVSVPDAGKMLFLGGFQYPIKKKAPYIQAFDPAAAKWSAYSEARPKRGVYPLYRVAYDAKGKKVYCLSQIMASAGRYFLQEGQLYSFDLDSNTWKQYPRDPAAMLLNECSVPITVGLGLPGFVVCAIPLKCLGIAEPGAYFNLG